MTYVDKEKCIGCQLCVNICPGGFKMEDGRSKVISQTAGCLEKAANACPVQAIIISNETKNH